MRLVFLSIGIVFVGLALIGIFVPILPTTPFLLVSCFCFTKSSEKNLQKLRSSKYFGSYVQAYYDKNGLTKSEKYRVYMIMWPMMLLSIYLVNNIFIRVLLITIMICVSIYIWKLKEKSS